MCSKDPSQLRDHTARGCQDDCWYRRTRPSSSSSSMAISTTSDRRSLLRLTRFRSIAASGPLSAPHSLWARELGKYSSLSDHSYLPCLSPFLARRNNLLFIAMLPNHYLLLFIQAKRLLSKVFLFFFFLLQGFLLVMHTAFQSYCMCQRWLKYSHIRSMCGALFGSGCGRTLWTLLFLFSGS